MRRPSGKWGAGNSYAPGLRHDFEKWLESLALSDPDPNVEYHNRKGEDNADTYLKRMIMGRELVCAIINGNLKFGRREQIFYSELDVQPDKWVRAKIIGDWPMLQGVSIAIQSASLLTQR